MAEKRQLAIRALLVGLIAGISACSGLNADNPAATFQAERAGYISEATSIAQSAEAQGTQVAATVVAAETYTMLMEGRNEQLLATMQIAVPPTQGIIDSNPDNPVLNPTPAPPNSADTGTTPMNESGNGGGDTTGDTGLENSSAGLGDAQFTQVGTASSVRDADGCADELNSAFAADVQVVYITTRALNVTSGTQMSVEWYYGGELAHSESYTIPSNDDDFCMWFSLVPNESVLSSGNWTVTLYADSQPIEPTQIPFTVG
jgi:hypothetical protein